MFGTSAVKDSSNFDVILEVPLPLEERHAERIRRALEKEWLRGRVSAADELSSAVQAIASRGTQAEPE